jgi:hypothetical protein
MWRYIFCTMIGLLTVSADAGTANPTTSNASYAIVERIAGPSGVTGWDYAAVDEHARRLFLATSYSSGGGVTLLDLSVGRATPNFVAAKTPHGFALLGNGAAVVSDAGKSAAVFFEVDTGKVLASVETGKSPKADGWHNPDALLLEPKTGLLVAVNGDSGVLALVDVSQHALVGSINVGGKLEAAAATGGGTVYVNVEAAHAIAAVDLPARKVLRRLLLKGCEEPTGLAYDGADDLLISVCGNGVAKFIDPQSGAELASIRVGKGADAVMFDAHRKVVFIAGGDDGTLSVIRVSDRHQISLIQTLDTQPGTRLGAIDPATGKLYLPTAKPDLKAPPLQLPGLPPIPPALSGSFEFLVVAARQ